MSTSRHRLIWGAVALSFMFSRCSDSGDNGTGPNPPNPGPVKVAIQNAFPNLNFSRPVFLTHSGDRTNRLFVVQQRGLIRVFPNDSNTGNSEVFLDLTNRVNQSGNETGLLGLAFHPGFGSNGFFYVNYTTGSGGNRKTVISRFTAAAQSNQADPNSEFKLLEFSQPFSNHNGGMLAFGLDGYLYIATGDGGGGGDPNNNGQDLTTLLGAILRIDVDRTDGGRNYSIPADNPFAGNSQGLREEIFAYGLRNPWRFSIDRQSGQILAADVGQNAREEVDVIEKGKNYGWRIMEGTLCFNPQTDCNRAGLTLPILDYGRSQGVSITGGYVYRGSAIPGLVGAYVYGDFGSGRIWMLTHDKGQLIANSELLDTNLSIASFGVDARSELYVVDLGGRIYRLANADGTNL